MATPRSARRLRLACVPALILAASPAWPQATAPVTPHIGSFGFDVSGMDRRVDPGDDFYRFANGAWDDRTVIPADLARTGAFQDLVDLSNAETRVVVEAAAADPAASGVRRQVGDMFASFMDEARIEARGAAVLDVDLARVAALRTPSDLAAAFGWLSRTMSFVQGGRLAVIAPVRISVAPDARDPDVMRASVTQGALGLPDRDYYLKLDNPGFAKARAAYEAHVARMLTLAGLPDDARHAHDVVALETAMAQAMWSREQRRDRDRTFNPTPVADLATRYPGFDWAAFMAAGRIGGQTLVNVGEPDAVRALVAMVATVPVETWRAYLAFSVINARAPVLPAAFVAADFEFQKAVSGTPQLAPRWKRGIEFVSPTQFGGRAGLGEAVGQLYAERYFPAATKARVEALVANLLQAMKAHVAALPWMDDATKTRALAKVAAFRAKIGYPDRWLDYRALRIDRDDAYGNMARAAEFNYDLRAVQAGGKADRGDWTMTPQTVNAYANPAWVEVVFPAAILRPPFFDPAADDAVNYGGIGVVIGHEISHHFDDQGSKYDEHGRLATWWSPRDVARFKALTGKVVAQYSAYEPLPGVHVKGENTQGENIADLAGVTIAHDAWVASLGGKPAPLRDGFTGEQRFFLGFAQVWRTKYREAQMLRTLTSDEHTPGNWRPYVVRNIDAWYAAFDPRPGSRFWLAPAERIRIW